MSVETPLEESATSPVAAPARSPRPVPASRPDITRPSERSRRAGAVRPGGRRGAPELPAVRPRVRAGGGVAPRPVPVVIRRRRRVAVAVLGIVLAALVAVAVALAGGGSPSTGGAPSAATTVTVVGAGESLGDVAHRTAPAADTSATVERIRELNGLSSSAVSTGRPLVVPAG